MKTNGSRAKRVINARLEYIAFEEACDMAEQFNTVIINVNAWIVHCMNTPVDKLRLLAKLKPRLPEIARKV